MIYHEEIGLDEFSPKVKMHINRELLIRFTFSFIGIQ